MANKPVLYFTARSAPCRAVLLTAAEIGLELELRVMNLQKGDHRTPEFLKMNPQHTIPVLDDNGVIITDSHVICMYLADKYSTDEHLYPKELVARNLVITRLFYDCGNIFSRVRRIVEPILWFGSTAICQEAVQYAMKAYDGLEHCLKESPYVCGQYMTIADLCCIASMSSAHDLAPVDGKKYPNVLAWIERMTKLPYYQRCNREGADVLRDTVMSKLEENKKAWV